MAKKETMPSLLYDKTEKNSPCGECINSEPAFTPYVKVETHDDGTSEIVTTTLEELTNPMAYLDVSDFSIRKLLKAGVKIHKIDINMVESRVGVSSAAVAAFNANIDNLRSEIYKDVEPLTK